MKVQTQTLYFAADNHLIDLVEKKIRKLERFFEKIIEATVTLKLEKGEFLRNRIAEIKLWLPGSVLFVRVSSKSFEASVDSALINLKGQLKRYKEKFQKDK